MERIIYLSQESNWDTCDSHDGDFLHPPRCGREVLVGSTPTRRHVMEGKIRVIRR
jgi:hypothetical protein